MIGGVRKTLVTLQYLRAVAALMVVYFHAVLQIRLLAGERTLFPLLGAGGVDLFFVLSGFMMWHAIEQGASSPGDFLRRRIVRIVPLYWIVTLAALAVASVAPSLLRSTVADPAHALASLLFVPWRNPGVAATGSADVLVPVIVPGWTLNFEMAFYLLFAAMLPASKHVRLPLLALLLAGLFLVSGFWRGALPLLGFYHKDILFEFLIGSALGAAGLHRRPIPAMASIGLAVTGFVLLPGLEAIGGAGLPRIVSMGVPATMILVAALGAEAAGSPRHVPILTELGNASFSLYLTHGFVLAGLRIACMKGMPGIGTPFFQVAFLIAAVSIAGGVGLLVYRLVERPMIRLAGRRSSMRRRIPALRAVRDPA